MTDDDESDDIDFERSREEKLKAIIRKDVDPVVTAIAKEALRRRQKERDDDR
jgi:hypothetical protein